MLVRQTKGYQGLAILVAVYCGWMTFLAYQDSVDGTDEEVDVRLVDPNNAIVKTLPDGRILMSDGSIRRQQS